MNLCAQVVALWCSATAAAAAAFAPGSPPLHRRPDAGGAAVRGAEAAAPPVTALSFLPPETVERARTGSPIEKMKLERDVTSAWVDVYEYAQRIREGTMTWEEIEKADLDNRLKWAGLLHRAKRTPGQFMMRLRVPNGICSSDQLRFYADSVEKYGPKQGVVDITTRQNIQLRGVRLEDADAIIEGLHARNQTCFQSALDNVRNVVGSPLAGLDDQELVDTRPLCAALNDLVSLDPVTGRRGSPRFANLPRKLNFAVSGGRDDYAHTHINDVGLVPVRHAGTRAMGFNVVLGGFMSIKRVAAAVDGDMWIPADVNSVVTFCEELLSCFRDHGERRNRQEARLMYLVEQFGIEGFKKIVTKEVKSLNREVFVQDAQPLPDEPFVRRELLGVHKQAQEGKVRVGIHVPTGRLSPLECRAIADLADKYSCGEIRLTVEQNIILPNVDEPLVEQLLSEPALTGTRLQVNPGMIEGHLVSCTGSEFCGLALIETKSNAQSLVKRLEKLVKVDRPIRIHWTGCPNSCGQVQAADIGIMGAPARKEVDGKSMAVPGCKIFVGGRIGEDAHLATEPIQSNVPLDEADLIPVLVDVLKLEFGAVDLP